MDISYDEVKAAIQRLSDQETRALLNWVANDELPRREDAVKEEAAKATLIKELQDSGKVDAPNALPAGEPLPGDVASIPEWQNPGTDHTKMYRKGDRVLYNGKVVVSTHEGLNSWEPGTLGFDGRIWEYVEENTITPGAEDQPDEPKAVLEFVQPTGAHNAYSKGDKVTYNGKVYESVIDSNVWSPDAYPAGWSVVEG